MGIEIFGNQKNSRFCCCLRVRMGTEPNFFQRRKMNFTEALDRLYVAAIESQELKRGKLDSRQFPNEGK